MLQGAPPPSLHALPLSFSPSQPCTFPIMLYLLVKKVSQSFNTPCSFSPRSSYSGLQSSGLSDDVARAREASLPAKTDEKSDDSMMIRKMWQKKKSMQRRGNYTMICTAWGVCVVARDIEDRAFDGYPYRQGTVRSYIMVE